MLSALFSLAVQAARLIGAPRMARRALGRVASEGGAGRCGHCPVCQAFICLGAAEPGGTAPCPRCGRSIPGVEPLA